MGSISSSPDTINKPYLNMKSLEQNIHEALGIKKSFILNMKEIDYDKLLSFISDMKDKQEKYLVIEIEANGRKWFGYSSDDSGNSRNNKTILN